MDLGCACCSASSASCTAVSLARISNCPTLHTHDEVLTDSHVVQKLGIVLLTAVHILLLKILYSAIYMYISFGSALFHEKAL